MADRNPFNSLAYLLFNLRVSLEEIEQPGRPPRWVRIARVANTGTATTGPSLFSTGTITAMGAIIDGLAWMQELVLDMREIIVEVDGLKALIEAGVDLLEAASDSSFINSLTTLLGTGAPAAPPPPNGFNSFLEDVQNTYLPLIPEPDDLDRIEHELYRLLCIHQEALPLISDVFDPRVAGPGSIGDSTEEHIDMVKTGKLRLLGWAFKRSLKTRGLGPEDDPESIDVELLRFGSRRIWTTLESQGVNPDDVNPSNFDHLPSKSEGWWGPISAREQIFDFNYENIKDLEGLEDDVENNIDIIEGRKLLKALGYLDDDSEAIYDDKLVNALHKFQAINDLPRTHRFDNDTINRLMNLDFGLKRLKRAIPYEASKDPLAALGPEGIELADGQQPPDSSGFVPEAATPIDREIRGGQLKLYNPDADRPTDEELNNGSPAEFLRDQVGYSYYPIPVAKNRGWQSDNVEASVGFVALESRRRVETAPGSPFNGTIQYDGGQMTEAEAASGTHFWAARNRQPWLAGHNGQANGNPTLIPAGAPTVPNLAGGGPRSRIYQWVDLSQLKAHFDTINGDDGPYEIAIWGESLQRALYRNRQFQDLGNGNSNGFGRPDLGRISVEFYRATGNTEGDGPPSIFDANALATRPDGGPGTNDYRVLAELQPPDDAPTGFLDVNEIPGWWLWFPTRTPEFVLRKGDNFDIIDAAMITLEGVWRAGPEIDVYFDEVRVRWAIRRSADD